MCNNDKTERVAAITRLLLSPTLLQPWDPSLSARARSGAGQEGPKKDELFALKRPVGPIWTRVNGIFFACSLGQSCPSFQAGIWSLPAGGQYGFALLGSLPVVQGSICESFWVLSSDIQMQSCLTKPSQWYFSVRTNGFSNENIILIQPVSSWNLCLESWHYVE